MMTLITIFLGLVVAGVIGLLAHELHRTEDLVQKLEQYAANERRPKHGNTIHSNYHEPVRPAFQTVSQKIFDRLNGRR